MAELVVCILICIANCLLLQKLIVFVMFMQLFNLTSLIGVSIWRVCDIWKANLSSSIPWLILIDSIAILRPIFELHFLICCYRLVLYKKHTRLSYGRRFLYCTFLFAVTVWFYARSSELV
ncbi:hypothetical protein PMAYCL1PPCAC_08460 [Pristionchus mayeri]|uniref:Uncharacterized protein n=1 Tax=Pristionchus mayeri TaxID=1317129 RepID=A0AAN4ZJQ8_9BILA|nr:hypothetical protein PMAYCL1PPCAC_08460 [Pristionchus mayeri]